MISPPFPKTPLGTESRYRIIHPATVRFRSPRWIIFMPRIPKPWFRKDRQAYFVTINGVRHNLGPDKKQAERLYHELMAKSAPLGIVDSVPEPSHSVPPPTLTFWTDVRC